MRSDEVPSLALERRLAGTDALAPEACFAIVSGLLTGARTPFSGRIQIVGKSPLTGSWADSNSGGSVRRGNILVWEQPLAARQRGEPLILDARMQTDSILYRTLWLFAATFAAVAAAFALVIWWMMSRPVRGSHHADTV